MTDSPLPAATATGLHAQADLPVGTLVAGRFRIEALLGIGGMGVVYRAIDQSLDVPVALKLLRPEVATRADAFERFRQELLLARQVSSPHVVRIHDLAQHEGRWLISMDLVDGESLDGRLDREGRFPVDEALRIARDVAEGLSAAHAKGVVHRDLKPANILLDAQGTAFISDFGVARSLATPGLTATGAVVGTAEYLSPEQARGATVDSRSDLYALGLVLYEMLVGKPPFSGATIAESLAQRMLRPPEPVSRQRPDVPPWVTRLVDKLLRPQPSHRFQDARAVVAAIDRREVAREFRATRGAGIALAAMLVGAAIGGGWWWSQQGEQAVAEVAPSAPLRRLLVLAPVAPNADEALSAQLVGAGAHLRDALSEVPGFAVVDQQRTWQALRQVGPASGDSAALARAGAAERVLRLRVLAAPGGWRVAGELHAAGAPAPLVQGPVAADPVSALQAWARAPSTGPALGLRMPVPELRLPAVAALQGYGEALLAAQSDDLPAVLQRLQATTAKAPQYTDAWLAQANAAGAIGDEAAAFAAIEAGQASAERAPPRLRQRYLATRALLEGDAPAAIGYLQALASATPDDTGAALDLARAQGAGGDFKAAISGLQVLTGRDAQDPRGWYELGKFSILSGEAQRAVDEYLVRALVLYKRGDNMFGEAETVNALGIGYGRLGQTADAEEQYRKAIELRGQIGNKRGEATSRSNLAAILSLRGQFEEASQQLQQARALRVALDDRAGLAAVDHDMGLLAEERGDFPVALAAYKRSLQAWQAVGDAHGVAQALDGIGFARYQLGAYDDAQAYWLQAAQAYAGLGDETGDVRTRQNLGLLAMARGQWRQSRDLLEKSLAAAERLQMPEEIAVSRRHLAELALLQGHYAEALVQATQAAEGFRQREDAGGSLQADLLRTMTLVDLHANDEAAQALQGLDRTLKQAPSEQRAAAAMLHGVLAGRRGDQREARQRYREATALARQSGIRALQVQAALHANTAGSLDVDTATLGNADLRLAWLEQSMRNALRLKQPGQAVAAYRQAQPLLRAGDHRRAWALHRLAATALSATGEGADAAVAEASAKRMLQAVLAQMPEDRRSAFLRANDAVPAP
ncbi:MAG: protein kinase [Pseudomonadota bacterium]